MEKHKRFGSPERDYRGSFPRALSRRRKRDGVASAPIGASTEVTLDRYVDLKTNLLSRHPNGRVKTILFTGTSHGDGVSTTALHFAETLARDGRFKVLLVEVNLRTPSLRQVCQIRDNNGLFDVLAGNGRKVYQIRKVGPGSLYVITGGRNQPEPVNLLESARFDQFLGLAREKFDYIILDGPPVPFFSEFRVLCSKVDGVVLVVVKCKTRRQVALRAKEELQNAGGKVLGVVVNRWKYFIPEWIYRRL